METGNGTTSDNAALVVVDVQNGFINRHSEHAVPAIAELTGRWLNAGRPVVFTRYFNWPGSSFERFFSWSKLQGPPETELVPELAALVPRARAVIDKMGYAFLTPEAEALVGGAGWTDLVFCGIATDSCVLKSAADAVERGYAPWLVNTHSSALRGGVGRGCQAQ